MIFDDKISSKMETIYVKAIPEDSVKFILAVQAEMKFKKGRGNYSQSQTVVHIIKQYESLLRESKALPAYY